MASRPALVIAPRGSRAERIGGLGKSMLIATEQVEDGLDSFPLMVAARSVLGVLYKD